MDKPIVIQRPDEPRHHMQISQLTWPVSAEVHGRQIAYSQHALYIQEVGKQLYRPVVYFPLNDVQVDWFSPAGRHTECPLKGVTDYFDLRVDEQIIKHVAWQYTKLYEYDDNLQLLAQHVAFDSKQVFVKEYTHLARPQ